MARQGEEISRLRYVPMTYTCPLMIFDTDFDGE